MGCPADRVVVVVPAHDEQARLTRCLAALGRAAQDAARRGTCPAVDVAVVAHRCTDATAALARGWAAPPGVTCTVVEDDGSQTVGEVRDLGVRTALAAPGPRTPPERTWVLSTDADSEVPADWVHALLAVAGERGAVALAGMVELVDWQATAAAREAYAQIVEAGLTGPDTHTHAYAANLAVRADAYLAAGGFPAVAHGEETALLAALVRLGHPVASTRSVVVRTSGRMPGRARHGLGDLLARLDSPRAAQGRPSGGLTTTVTP